MAFNVRFHAYAGLRQIPRLRDTQFASDSVNILAEPYIWGQSIPSNLLVPVRLVPSALAGVFALRVEVADAQAIRYEINTNATEGTVNERAAGLTSPKLSGIDIFEFHPGWGFQFIDASGT